MHTHAMTAYNKQGNRMSQISTLLETSVLLRRRSSKHSHSKLLTTVNARTGRSTAAAGPPAAAAASGRHACTSTETGDCCQDEGRTLKKEAAQRKYLKIIPNLLVQRNQVRYAHRLTHKQLPHDRMKLKRQVVLAQQRQHVKNDSEETNAMMSAPRIG